MTEKLCDDWGNLEEDLIPHLMAWAGSVKLTGHEAASIRNSILENVTGDSDELLERMLARIDRTMARSERRINQTVALQTDLIDRRLMRTGS